MHAISGPLDEGYGLRQNQPTTLRYVHIHQHPLSFTGAPSSRTQMLSLLSLTSTVNSASKAAVSATYTSYVRRGCLSLQSGMGWTMDVALQTGHTGLTEKTGRGSKEHNPADRAENLANQLQVFAVIRDPDAPSGVGQPKSDQIPKGHPLTL